MDDKEDSLIKSVKAYSVLNCNFWDNDNSIAKNYDFKRKMIENSIKNTLDEEEYKKKKILKEMLDSAIGILMNDKVKSTINIVVKNKIFTISNAQLLSFTA